MSDLVDKVKVIEDKQETTDLTLQKQGTILGDIQRKLQESLAGNQSKELPTSPTSKVEVSIVIPVPAKWEKSRYSIKNRSFVPLLDILSDLDFDRSVFEVILVIDASVGRFLPKVIFASPLLTYQAGIKVVSPSKHALQSGWASFCDEGAKDATGEHILFLSPSTMVSPDYVEFLDSSWVRKLKEATDEDNVALLNPKILDRAGLLHELWVYSRLGNLYSTGMVFDLVEISNPKFKNYTSHVIPFHRYQGYYGGDKRYEDRKSSSLI